MHFTMTVMFEGRAIEINKDAGITHVNMGSLQLLGILNNHAETGLITEAARRGDLVNVSFAGKIAKGIKEAALYAILTTSPVIYGDLWARLRSCITMQVGQEEARRLAQIQWEAKENARAQADRQFIEQERQKQLAWSEQLRNDILKETAAVIKQVVQQVIPSAQTTIASVTTPTTPIVSAVAITDKKATMEPEAVTLDFHGKKVRTRIEGGKIWWCATDVCSILGYGNTPEALSKHCKEGCITKRDIPHPQSKNKTIEMSFINESNLYRLIMRSRMPDAEKFQDWVTEDVLPTISEKGYYITNKKAADLLADPISAYRDILAHAESLQTKNVELEAKAEQLEAAGTEKDIEIRKLKSQIGAWSDSEGLTITTLIAKQLEMTAIMLNRFLVWVDILFRKGGALVPCADYDGKNLGKLVSQPYESKDKLTGEVTTKTAYNWKWTGAGSNLIIEKWIDLREAWKAAGCPGHSRTRKVKPTPEDK